MRSLRWRTAGIVAVLITAGVAWLGWKAWVLPQALPPILTLEVNSASELAVVQGTPFIFTVYLSGSETGPALHIGAPWHEHVRLELAENGQPLPWKVIPLGVPQSLFFGPDASAPLTVDNRTTGSAVVDAEHVHTIELGIDPEEASKIPVGRHMLKAVLTMPFWPPWRWHGRIASDAVTIIVSARTDGASPTDPSEHQRLIGSARFYLRASRFEDAQRVARQLVEHDPRSAEGHLLLGDALNGLHHDKEALNAYQSALLLSASDKRQGSAPPVYLMGLMERMHEVEERLRHQ